MSETFKGEIPPQNHKSPEKPKEKDFLEGKSKALDFLRREKIGKDQLTQGEAGLIDENIKRLVLLFNNLPFLYTTGSCGGHLFTKEDILRKYPDTSPELLQLPITGVAIYGGGNITFTINPANNRSFEFIKEVQKFIKNYPNAKLRQFDRSPNQYKLEFDAEKAKDAGCEEEEDIFPVDKAQQKEIVREKLKNELVQLVNKFLQ